MSKYGRGNSPSRDFSKTASGKGGRASPGRMGNPPPSHASTGEKGKK